MKYMLLVYADPDGFAALKPAEAQAAMAGYAAFTEALEKEKALLHSQRLKPTSQATTVHVENGTPKVLNGPYVETKEQLGGYFLIEAPDLDAAIKWAARCPGSHHGSVEVRPVWEM
ncbi:MAG TPA: YciI family protein [Rhizomicrobium sp.]|nr:YciI family protein [Rhizomicrobium sp.]